MKSRSRNIMIAVFTIPAMIAIATVFVYPVIRTIMMSFFTIDNVVSRMSDWTFAGVSNYVQLIQTPLFRQTWVTFLKIWVFGGIVIMCIAMLFAVILTSGVRGKSFWRAAIYLPNIISAVALANMWIHYAYNPNWGLFHNIFSALGLESLANFQWTSPDHLFLAMMVAYCFGAVGYYMLIYIAEIEKIPQDIFEAAKIDGSSGVHSFFHITLPMLSPMLKIILMLAITGAFKDYESIMVLTQGGPNNRTQVMFLYIYQLIFGTNVKNPQIGYGTVLSLMAAVIVGAVTGIYLLLARKLDDVM